MPVATAPRLGHSGAVAYVILSAAMRRKSCKTHDRAQIAHGRARVIVSDTRARVGLAFGDWECARANVAGVIVRMGRRARDAARMHPGGERHQVDDGPFLGRPFGRCRRSATSTTTCWGRWPVVLRRRTGSLSLPRRHVGHHGERGGRRECRAVGVLAPASRGDHRRRAPAGASQTAGGPRLGPLCPHRFGRDSPRRLADRRGHGAAAAILPHRRSVHRPVVHHRF